MACGLWSLVDFNLQRVIFSVHIDISITLSTVISNLRVSTQLFCYNPNQIDEYAYINDEYAMYQIDEYACCSHVITPLSPLWNEVFHHFLIVDYTPHQASFFITSSNMILLCTVCFLKIQAWALFTLVTHPTAKPHRPDLLLSLARFCSFG